MARRLSRVNPTTIRRAGEAAPVVVVSFWRTVAAAVGICAFGGGAWIALRYPLARPLALIAFAGWTALAWCFPRAWLVVLPAAVPVIGFASWTGWLLAEEIDLVVLGAVAAGYARIALYPPNSEAPVSARGLGSSLIVALLV